MMYDDGPNATPDKQSKGFKSKAAGLFKKMTKKYTSKQEDA